MFEGQVAIITGAASGIGRKTTEAMTTTLATTLGFLIPYILEKMGLDPAAGADPIITTIKDITGLPIYFSLAYWLLEALG